MGEDGLTGLRTSLSDTEWKSVKDKLGVGGKAAPQICDPHFRTIFDLGSLLTYPESMPIQRGRLREVLITEPSRKNIIHFSKVVKSYEILRDGGEEKVKLSFEDGTQEIGDLVIAADGSKSILNHLTGLRNRFVTDVRCITARINLTPEIVRSLPPTLQAGPVMFGLGQRTVCFSSLYLPVLDDPNSIYHKSSTLMWALAIGAKFWKNTLGYDPEELYNKEKLDQQQLFETALDLSEHWHSPELKSVLTADPVASIGYGAFRSSIKPSPTWRKDARAQFGGDAGSDRIWFMGDSMHAMTRISTRNPTNISGTRNGGKPSFTRCRNLI
jgi:2-polyprenyl-6-methoxyphenol hydroxylase-like FAD-dependent oxidoreductase